MNINKIIDKLTSKIKNNKEKTKNLDKDINNYHLLQLDGIVKTILKNSTYTYLGLTLISIITAKVVGITTIVNTIYPFLIPLVMGGISIGIGTLSTIVKYLITSNKLEKYRSISNEIKPLTQELSLKYEKEKINNKNKALITAITSLENNTITLPKSISLEQTDHDLEEKFQKLEELTKQHFYLKTKTNNNFIFSILKAILTVIISFITLILLYSLPLLLVNYSPVLLIPELANLPFQLIGGLSLSISLYSLSKSITNNRALTPLKYLLSTDVDCFTGEYLPLTITYKNIFKLNKDITNTIKDISKLKIIQVAKRIQQEEQQERQQLLVQQARKMKQHRTKSIAPRGQVDEISKPLTKRKVITGYSTKYKFDLH